MATLKITGFSGEIPKLIPRLLPDMSAQQAFNVRLDDGGLTPVRRSGLEVTLDPPDTEYQTIYRHGEDWMAWETDVHAAPGPVAQDRLYYTGDGAPKMLVDGTTYGLAVPRPGGTLSASATGSGSGIVERRVYAYTYVTDYGEESEPSDFAETTWQSGQEVDLSGLEDAPAGRNITRQRIYRSQTGSSGGTDLYLIDERAVSASNYTDSIAPEDFDEPLPSRFWTPPPDDLSGLISLPNGMMVAFDGKQLYFCEPYRPHAWPETYIRTVENNIVGLGAFGTSVVVVTDGTPYIFSGSNPESMVSEKMELNLPCINADSIQDMGYAVAYASYDGLVVVSSGGTRIATEEILSREAWLRLNPEAFTAGQFKGRYYASYRYSTPDGEDQDGTIIIDLSGAMPFIIRSNVVADAFYFSIEDGSLYYLVGQEIFEIDAPGELLESMVWRSKQFVLPRPTNFGAIMVEADFALSLEEIEAIENEIQQIESENADLVATGILGGAVNGAAVNALPVNGDYIQIPPEFSQFASISIYADGDLVTTINDLNQMKRLPSGFLARIWEVEVFGDTRISQISLATTATELQGI